MRFDIAEPRRGRSPSAMVRIRALVIRIGTLMRNAPRSLARKSGTCEPRVGRCGCFGRGVERVPLCRSSGHRGWLQRNGSSGRYLQGLLQQGSSRSRRARSLHRRHRGPVTRMYRLWATDRMGGWWCRSVRRVLGTIQHVRRSCSSCRSRGYGVRWRLWFR